MVKHCERDPIRSRTIRADSQARTQSGRVHGNFCEIEWTRGAEREQSLHSCHVGARAIRGFCDRPGNTITVSEPTAGFRTFNHDSRAAAPAREGRKERCYLKRTAT